MAEDTAKPGTPGAEPGGARPKSPGVDETLRGLNAARRETMGAARGTLSALRRLAEADLALARGAVGRGLVWASVAALLGCSAWLLLTAVLVAAVNALGLAWVWSLLVVAAVYLVVAGLCAWRMRVYLQHMGMRATRRQLAQLRSRRTTAPGPAAAPAPQGAE